MGRLKSVCSSLQQLCIDALFPTLDAYAEKYNTSASGPLDNLAGDVTELMMARAYEMKENWSQSWVIFLTPKIKRAYLPWDSKIMKIAKQNCRNIKEALVITRGVHFHSKMLDFLPTKLKVLDLDGELFYRGKGLPLETNSDWLLDAEFWLRHLKLQSQEISDISFDGLAELHLGQAKVSSDEISDILRKRPQLRVLKHYQLTTALCHLHGREWRTAPGTLPTYKLRNIDADFSHVVRCRMSPHSVLPPDALKLAVTLCPEATSIRLRFDCSTPHHVVSPLVNLKAVRELSAVCVTSGERTLLDFTDLIPILEHHGPKTLNLLELKVLEEVDPHVIGHVCTQLESLTLSGCGYVTPPTCQQFRCRKKAARLHRLRFLFYADGDDFSWDHSLPQCFWRTTMSSDERNKSFLECVCFESPRMTADTLKENFQEPAALPRLKILTICRAPEIDFETIENLSRAAPNLRYLRITSCDKITVRFGARIKKLYPDIQLKID